jgi:hypothetical protein
MWLIAYGLFVSFFTTSMSRFTAALDRKSDPIPPSPPAFETAAASSADGQVPIGARMIGTSISNKSQRGVLSIASCLGTIEGSSRAHQQRPLIAFKRPHVPRWCALRRTTVKPG